MFAKLKSALLPPALIVIGLIVAYSAYSDGRNFKAIADHGKVAEATVDSVSWKEKMGGREKGFKIDVHFMPENAKDAVKATLSISKSEGQRFRDTDADTVKIKYLPEAPNTVILADAADDSGFMMIVGGVMALVGVGIFVFRRRKKAAGVPAAA